MTRLTFVRPDGSRAEHLAEPGASVMEVAVARGEDGIVAECGGSLMCATCHVYLDGRSAALLPPPGEEEDGLLTCTAAERRPGSRLGCQVVLTDEVDAMVVELPDVQL